MLKEKKPQKIVFSKDIDSLINGLTLGFSFVAVGLFLILFPNYFGNEFIGQLIRWIFIGIGVLGLCIEFGKLKPMSNIKGFDDLWMGILLLSVWAVLFFVAENKLFNIIGFFFLMIGTYGTFQGLLKIIYSVHLIRKEKLQSKGTIFSDILVLMTKTISLALVVLQLIKAFNELG